jgi:hypothetical protein
MPSQPDYSPQINMIGSLPNKMNLANRMSEPNNQVNYGMDNRKNSLSGQSKQPSNTNTNTNINPNGLI